MKDSKCIVPMCLALLVLGSASPASTQAAPTGTAFTYQGRLQDGTNAATGSYDLRFAIYDAASGGNQVGLTLTNSAAGVTNGLFTAMLDFGSNLFTGQALWLESAARTNGTGVFALLPPREPLTPAPYALYAPQAGNARSVAGAAVSAPNLNTTTGPGAGQVLSYDGASLTWTSLSGTMLAPGSVDASALAPGAVSQLGTPNGVDRWAVQVANDGALGIGTTAPLAGLDIVTSPTYPAPLVMLEAANGDGVYTNLGGANCVAAYGQRVAIGAATPGGVTLLDCSQSPPVMQAEWYEGMLLRIPNPNHPDVEPLLLSQVAGVALSADLLAAAALGDNAVVLFSVSDPANLGLVAQIKDGVGGFDHLAGASAVGLAGHLLAVAAAADSAVTIVDVTDPTNPQPAAVLLQGVAGYSHLAAPVSVALSGNLLAIGSLSSNAVTLVDVSGPTNPLKLAEIVQGIGSFQKLHAVTSVALASNLLAIAAFGDNTVTLVDVSQPQTPRFLAALQDGVGGVSTLGGARSVTLSGNRLAVGAYQDNAVTVFDVADPVHPQVLSQARDGVAGAHYLGGVMGVDFVGDEVAVAAKNDSAFTLLGWWNQHISLVSEGWMGVGTEHPVAPLDVVGNLVVEDAQRVNINAQDVELGEYNRATGRDALALGREGVSEGLASLAAGYGARASGRAALALGDHTLAVGDGSVAIGSRAQALHGGSFVWADSVGGPYPSSGINQFLIRATGGVGINTNAPGGAALNVNGPIFTTNITCSGNPLTIGTTDGQPLEIRVGNSRALQVKAAPTDVRNAGMVNFVGGASVNYMAPGTYASVIVGGGAVLLGGYPYTNSVSADFSFLGGGMQNTIERGTFSFLGGGSDNTEGGDFSFLGGGQDNSLLSESSFLGGGEDNFIYSAAADSFLGGGWGNEIYPGATESVLAGGEWNWIGTNSDHSTLTGGFSNGIWGEATCSCLAGGRFNRLEASCASLGGGEWNSIDSPAVDHSVLGGGEWNRITGYAGHSLLGGGQYNIISGEATNACLVGGSNNAVCALGSVLGGGRNNQIGSWREPVGEASDHSLLGGGEGNLISLATHACLMGGSSNLLAAAPYSVLAGGRGNQILTNSDGSVIGGGTGNLAAGSRSLVAGGHNNCATNWYATVAGGAWNTAGGQGSFAAGRAARALDDGSFVWNCDWMNALASTGANQFLARASGGFSFYTSTSGGATLAPGSGSWTSMSDRNAKENITLVDPQAVLAKVVELPVSTWNYQAQNPAIRHLGPMAQDFKAAFGLGETDTGITSVDADGVALAAIQGLNQKLKQKDAEIQSLQQRIEALEKLVSQIAGQ